MFKIFKKYFKLEKNKNKNKNKNKRIIPEELRGKWCDLKVKDTFIRIIRKDIIEEIIDEDEDVVFDSSFSIQSLSYGTLNKMSEDYNTIIYDEIIDSIVLD
jgi:hypothetical protein